MDQQQVMELQEALPTMQHPLIHVEVCQKPCSTAKVEDVQQSVRGLLSQQASCYGNFSLTTFDDPFLQKHVESVSVCDFELLDLPSGEAVDLCKETCLVHVYKLHTDGPGQETLEDDEDLPAASHWLLPAAEFVGLWENLVFDSPVKSHLLQYASTTLLFSDRHVDSNVISWNRVVLLHGPPGTGKTSLCRALAQKLSIILSDRYSYGQLIEINSHSLFSKWFSESGKLVMRMFQKIQELIDDKESLVCVLIDEVESLTAARTAAMGGAEPSDAIRVVNALLTQLDQIKQYSNVMILTTSNITGAIDLAFVDRADIKQYIGLPSAAAFYKIYQSCINELMRTKIIAPPQLLLELQMFETNRKLMEIVGEETTTETMRLSQRLSKISQKTEGLSGRTARKLPFIAHALYIQANSVTLDAFLDALSRAVEKQFEDREHLEKCP